MKLSITIIKSSILLFWLNLITSRLMKINDFDLKNITPIFQKVETLPTPTETFIKFQSLSNYKTDYKYRLFISEFDKPSFHSNIKHFQNWNMSDEDYEAILEKESYWHPWKILVETNEKITKVTNLNENSYYRFKFIIFNNYSSSQESEINFVKTPRKKTHDNHVNLYVKGTGRNNHENVVIKLNENNIIINGVFQGLALVIFNRIDMSVSDISYYDTYNPPNEEPIKMSFFEYIYDDLTRQLTKNKVDKETINKKNFPSVVLFEKLKRLTERHMIVIVSCYGWEKYFTNDLIDILVKFGALNILEMKTFINQELSRSNNTFEGRLIERNHLHHPFAFVGIANIGGGNGYESFRTNKGHFLTTKNLPFAEMLIKIKYDEKAMIYFFDKIQYQDKTLYKDHYDYLFNSEDYSLKNLFDLLIYANTPSNINNLFAIYDINKYKNIYQLKTGLSNQEFYQTTFDIVTLGKSKPAVRYNNENVKFQDGLKLENLPYYDYYVKVGLNKTDCPPPYKSDFPQCLNEGMMNSDVPILNCKIGLTPQVCMENKLVENLFKGFSY